MEIEKTEHLDSYTINPWYTLGYSLKTRYNKYKGYVYVAEKDKKLGEVYRDMLIEDKLKEIL